MKMGPNKETHYQTCASHLIDRIIAPSDIYILVFSTDNANLLQIGMRFSSLWVIHKHLINIENDMTIWDFQKLKNRKE